MTRQLLKLAEESKSKKEERKLFTTTTCGHLFLGSAFPLLKELFLGNMHILIFILIVIFCQDLNEEINTTLTSVR